MSSNQSQVVVGFDSSHAGHAALYRAVALAARAPFHVLHFVSVVATADDVTRVRDEVAAAVEQELRAANTADRVHFNIHVLISHHPAKEILRVAEYVGADLVIIGTVMDHVIRDARCSVVIARPKEYAYVPLLDVVEVEAHPHHHEAHRYTYEDRRASLRPPDWPMY